MVGERSSGALVRKIAMDIKIREIYNNYNQANNWNDEISKKIERKIMEEIAEVQQIMEWKEFEKYRDRLFAVSEIAREGGFVSGFKYAVMLMAECYAGHCDITVKP